MISTREVVADAVLVIPPKSDERTSACCPSRLSALRVWSFLRGVKLRRAREDGLRPIRPEPAVWAARVVLYGVPVAVPVASRVLGMGNDPAVADALHESGVSKAGEGFAKALVAYA